MSLTRRLSRLERLPAPPAGGFPHAVLVAEATRRPRSACPDCAGWQPLRYHFAGDVQPLQDADWERAGRPARCERCGWAPLVVAVPLTWSEAVDAMLADVPAEERAQWRAGLDHLAALGRRGAGPR